MGLYLQWHPSGNNLGDEWAAPLPIEDIEWESQEQARAITYKLLSKKKKRKAFAEVMVLDYCAYSD